jgi:hypothetical protein
VFPSAWPWCPSSSTMRTASAAAISREAQPKGALSHYRFHQEG